MKVIRTFREQEERLGIKTEEDRHRSMNETYNLYKRDLEPKDREELIAMEKVKDPKVQELRETLHNMFICWCIK